MLASERGLEMEGAGLTPFQLSSEVCKAVRLDDLRQLVYIYGWIVISDYKVSSFHINNYNFCPMSHVIKVIVELNNMGRRVFIKKNWLIKIFN